MNSDAYTSSFFGTQPRITHVPPAPPMESDDTKPNGSSTIATYSNRKLNSPNQTERFRSTVVEKPRLMHKTCRHVSSYLHRNTSIKYYLGTICFTSYTRCSYTPRTSSNGDQIKIILFHLSFRSCRLSWNDFSYTVLVLINKHK